MYNKHTKRMIRGSMGLLVGVPLMSATAAQVNALPAGTAKTLAGTAVGLQGAAMLGTSLNNFRFNPKH